jgi:hypothetical protein
VNTIATTAVVLEEPIWLDRRRAHEARVRRWTDPHQARQARGERHPVEDFLWEYYAYRPSWLRRWHPGPNVVLLGDAVRDFLRWPEYRVVEVDMAGESASGVSIDPTGFPASRRDFLQWLALLLCNAQERPPSFGCFGLHEWAMIYGLTADQVRHTQLPLRLSAAETASVVESLPVRCSHFDAFRFFTPEAQPLNRLQPERATTAQLEQRGCLHANMDLYKWAFKLAPFTPSELMADCFELAFAIRQVDMRASPYDCRSLGLEPITIETSEGRAEYERLQRDFAERSQPLRARLLALVEHLVEAGRRA